MSLIKKTIKLPLNMLGYDTVSLNETRIPKVMDRLKNMKNHGFNPKVIIDGGAHLGKWSESMSEMYPKANFIIVEPNPAVNQKIEERINPTGIKYELIKKALGPEKGETFLNVWEEADTKLVGSSICEHVRDEEPNKVTCEVINIDSIAEEFKVTPDLVKLDLQGYELEALKGATKVMEKAELFLIEFGCLEAYVERATPRDLINFMYDHNFSLYDIVDLHYRPYDNALTGGDFFFISNNSPLKEYKGWE